MDRGVQAVERSRHQERHQALSRLSRRYTLMLSAVVGVLAGVMAVIFRTILDSTELLRGTASSGLWERYHYFGAIAVVLCTSILGAAAASLTQMYCPEAGGSGIPHIKAVLVTARPMRSARIIVTKLGAGVLALVGGMSLGREGPTVHMGGAIAALFSKGLHLPGRTQRHLIAAGAGAGLAAVFNAPLAGFLFIMEELRREMSRGTYGNALITAVSSVAVTRMLIGSDATYSLPDVLPLPLKDFPVIILTGLAAALVGRVFNDLLMRTTDKGFSGKRLTPGWNGALVGALGGVLIFALPEVTGGGHRLTHDLLEGRLEHHDFIPYLLLLLCMKLLFTVLCYATGVPGGIFAPLLTMGAILGYMLGDGFALIAPGITPSPARLATIGMAAVLTASVRAPLTGVVLIVEMTGQYHMLYSLLLASFVAYAASEGMKTEPIYEALLSRDLKHDLTKVSADARVLEIAVEPGSLFDRRQVSKIKVPEDLLIAIIDRGNQSLVPHGTTRLEAGDFLTVVVGPNCPNSDMAEFLESARGM